MHTLLVLTTLYGPVGDPFPFKRSVVPLPPIAAPTSNATIPDGCGSDTGLFNSTWVPQSIGGGNFRPACNLHDICYGTSGAAKKDCDDRFRRDLRRACVSPEVKRPPIHLRSAGPAYQAALLFRCLGAAEGYHVGVRYGGAKAYHVAQYQANSPAPTGPSLVTSRPSVWDRASVLSQPTSSPKYGLVKDLNPPKPAGNGPWSGSTVAPPPKPGPLHGGTGPWSRGGKK